MLSLVLSVEVVAVSIGGGGGGAATPGESIVADALIAFRRSVHLLLDIDSINRAADVALAAFQELDERLAIKDAITASGRPLVEEVFLLEHELIKHALVNAQGKVTLAARSLRMSYQKLTHKLNTRHKDLLQYRNPSRQRKRRK
ncbi:MAG TPA: hypothetical protein VF435_06105 [Pyrinomonadaceae bacterium]